MTRNKWQMHRAGLVNFWYYDDEEFYFADGKLLLRGLNGSGKSVTMQSLVTVLLDGKIAANRLDPFGTKDRRMEDYLLGEKDVVDRDERTGYLYLEYKRKNTEQYLTTGIGLKAKRGSSLEFWGFVITDNRRVGRDMALYKTEYSAADGKEERIPLTRAELERAIGAGGQVVRTQQDYMAMVNRYIFGFASTDAYKDLMELLIQLRSPKLSKDFKPTVIHEILTDSLPTLSEEELRPLADTIENMEQTKQQIDQLELHKSAVSRLSRQYDSYNRLMLAWKAEETVRATQRSAKAERDYKACVQDMLEKSAAIERLSQEIAAYEREEAVLRKEAKALEEHDVFKAEQHKQELEQELLRLEQDYHHKEQELARKQHSERQERKNISIDEQNVDEAETKMLQTLEELAALAQECAYENHALAVKEFEQNYHADYRFERWQQEVERYRKTVQAAHRKLREHTAAKLRQETIYDELDQARMALDMARQNWHKDQAAFFAGRQQLLEELYGWIKAHAAELPLTAEELRQAAISLQGLFEEAGWQDVLAPVDQAWRRREGEYLREKHALNHELALLRKEQERITAELTAWKQHKDPEPLRHADTTAARQRLAESQVPFVPLYAAVEFRQAVSTTERERIEAALTEMGLLDALIVPRSALSKLDGNLCDKVIIPEPAILAQTLADYLEPVPVEEAGVTAADIDEVLRSILVDDTIHFASAGRAAALSVANGAYAIGLTSGQAPGRGQAIYIGKEARRRFRQQEIQRLEEELGGILEQISALDKQVQAILAAVAHLEDVRQSFPAPEAVESLFQQQEKAARQVEYQDAEVRRKNEAYRASVDTVRQLQEEVKQITAGISLPITEDAFEAALDSLRLYQQSLHELQLAHQAFTTNTILLARARSKLAETQADVDRLKGECLVLAGAVKEKKLQLSHICARLDELGADEIKEKITAVIARLNELPGLIKAAIQAQADAKAQRDKLQSRERQLVSEKVFLASMVDCWHELLRQEQELRLVAGMENLPPAAILAASEGLAKADGREKAARSLTDSYLREMALLVEYRLTMEEISAAISLPALPEGEHAESCAWQLDVLRSFLTRQKVVLEYAGRKVSPAAAMELMEEDLSTQRLIQSRQDRELYEEVILNSIGRVISKRIQNAEQWAEQMNALMTSLNTSSGLTFSLRWRPLTADKDEQMDTAELVELLRSDHRLLKPEDMDRVVRHFRSRIEQAKAAAAGKLVTFQQAVQEVLDFRRWFTFTLYFRREGQAKKELTNSAFGKFSGGEKAMAMYVPLFSAAYSRYGEARDDAPYIISLDEAFAGVDENNIREMFDLVEKLGFNYIMNSQSLWGDYDTVAKLAIYELVRPKNAPYVTLIPYYWDGRVRQLMVEVS